MTRMFLATGLVCGFMGATPQALAVVSQSAPAPAGGIAGATTTTALPTPLYLTAQPMPDTDETLYLGSFNIDLNIGASLATNANAVAAFNRAADRWESLIADPITVTIDAELNGSLPSGVIGGASPASFLYTYADIRNVLIADASDELTQVGGFDDLVTTFLPANLFVTLPTGVTPTGLVTVAAANAKALGLSDPNGAAADADITFSDAFTYDFDRSDGINAGAIDFEAVATHEIGHALGFLSVVDRINDGQTSTPISILDLYRFDEGDPLADPETLAEFATFARNLVPGNEANSDFIDNEFRMSTGLDTGNFALVDGRQASHWKDDVLFGSLIGVMDPTDSGGSILPITFADARAFDLIGYDIGVIPEPAAGFMLLGMTLMCVSRRRG